MLFCQDSSICVCDNSIPCSLQKPKVSESWSRSISLRGNHSQRCEIFLTCEIARVHFRRLQSKDFYCTNICKMAESRTFLCYHFPNCSYKPTTSWVQMKVHVFTTLDVTAILTLHVRCMQLSPETRLPDKHVVFFSLSFFVYETQHTSTYNTLPQHI